MKVINIFSLYVTRDQNSTGAIWEEIIDHLRRKNTVKVFTTNTSKSISNSPDTRAVIGHTGDRTKLDKLIQNFTYSISFLLTMIRLERSSTVFLGTNPPTLLLAAAIARKIRGHRMILLSHDVYPDNLIAGHILKSKKSVSYKILNTLFRKSYSSADKVIAIGRDMEEILSEFVPPQQIEYIPCWISDYEKLQKSKTNRTKGIKKEVGNKLTFTYFGNIGRLQDVDNIVYSSDLLPKSSKIQIDIIGNGPARKSLEDSIRKIEPSNLRYLGECSPSDKWSALQHGNVALITLKPDMYGLGVPSKLYYSILSKQPILYVGDENSEVARAIDEFKLGIVVPPADPCLLALAFQEFYEHFDKISNNAEFDRAITRYSQNRILERIENLI